LQQESCLQTKVSCNIDLSASNKSQDIIALQFQFGIFVKGFFVGSSLHPTDIGGAHAEEGCLIEWKLTPLANYP